MSGMNATSRQAREAAQHLALGVGCKRGISEPCFERGVLAVLEQHGLTLHDVVVLASIDSKVSEPAMLAFAAKHRLELRFFSAAELKARAGHANPSELVNAHVATPSVSEPAALLAAGAATLLVAKTVYTEASHALTVAIASMAATCARAPRPGAES